MNSEYRSQIRGLLLVTCFIMIVPLMLFPRDLGVKLNISALLLLGLELGWYAIVLFILFPKESASRILPSAVITLFYRLGLGVGFGMLLLVMFSLPLSSSLSLGAGQYAPAFLLQAIMSPFVLKPVFEIFFRNRRISGKPRMVGLEKEGEEILPSTPSEKPEEIQLAKRSIPSEKEYRVTSKVNLESILHYLREYTGVKAVLLVDQDGLVVACELSPGFDGETIASFSRHLKECNDRVLCAMGGGVSERIGIHTADLWMCFHQIGEITLVVLSERRTDELLSVRIMQATAMIEKFLKEKYQLDLAKTGEAQYV